MDARPVVVVLAATGAFAAEGSSSHARDEAASHLLATLRQVVASGLPLVVVTTAALAGSAGGTVARADVVPLPQGGPAVVNEGAAIAAGVLARPQAPGWLLLPASLSRVQPATLNRLAAALADHPVAYAQFRGRRGHPIAVSAELYSELVSLSAADGVRRLLARYPAHGVDVPDAGVVASDGEGPDASSPEASDMPPTLAAMRRAPKR
jgi:molybdenum cofactor cytidylyltransferase